MAKLEDRRSENEAGDFFVDTTCIDCDACRWIAPSTFERRSGLSAVHRQPSTPEELRQALQALVSCPTSSIGTESKHAMKEVLASFPIPVAENVFHCGYHEESSFGAATYFLQRPEGNVLIDSPRFAGPLIRRLEALGGVKTMFLTHVDDVGDHQKFHDHFGCERVLHSEDARGRLRNVERLIDGEDPVSLDEDLLVVPVPGHTKGSCVLLYRGRYLFSGDHVAWSEGLGQVYAFRSACWYDWEIQIESMKRLADFTFEWILPGHGRRCRFEAPRMRTEMERAVRWMQAS